MDLRVEDVFPFINEGFSKEDFIHAILLDIYERLENTKSIELLQILYRSGQILSMNELQKKANLTQYKYYEELARLEGSGFIQKKKNLNDQRVTNIELTNQACYILNYINSKEERLHD